MQVMKLIVITSSPSSHHQEPDITFVLETVLLNNKSFISFYTLKWLPGYRYVIRSSDYKESREVTL